MPTRENGCVWLIPGPHRRGQVLRVEGVPSVDREICAEVDESLAIPLPLRAGEAFLMHYWTLHKSGANRSDRDHRILFMRYADTDAVEVYNGHKPRLGRLLRALRGFPK